MINLTRRQFGLAAMAASVGGASASAQPGVPTVRLPDGSLVPALGQGSAGLAGGRHPPSQEEEALAHGHIARHDTPRHGRDLRKRKRRADDRARHRGSARRGIRGLQGVALARHG